MGRAQVSKAEEYLWELLPAAEEGLWLSLDWLSMPSREDWPRKLLKNCISNRNPTAAELSQKTKKRLRAEPSLCKA